MIVKPVMSLCYGSLGSRDGGGVWGRDLGTSGPRLKAMEGTKSRIPSRRRIDLLELSAATGIRSVE